MNCPNCKDENPNEAYFCHSCGYKLRNKTNGWRITAILFLILLIVLGCLVLNYNAEISYLESDCRYYQDRINSLNRQIENLRSQLPQTYYTKYAQQYMYNKCAGNYEKSSCYFPSKGSAVTIYTTSDGYGLVHSGGWIPMNCLEKR